MLCKICKSSTMLVFNEVVLLKYPVNYYQCPSCQFIQTEDPYWLPEAYQSAIDGSDTGIVIRNETLRKIVTSILFLYFKSNGKYIDYGGGSGLFTRMMRDIGYDFYWMDKYAHNLLAQGFEHETGVKYNASTAFEVFEHLVSPMDEINKILEYSDTIIFSTVLTTDTTPEKTWWYYGFNHGQHVALYHYRTLQYIAGQLGLNLYSDKKGYHILSRKKLPMLNFSLIRKANKLGLFYIIKLMLKSKTITDHHLLIKKGSKV
jgi:hypothetical protein